MRLLIALAAAPLLAQTYYPFGVDQDKVAGAPDFSFLNQPLTAADRIFVRNGRFFRVGPDLKPNTEDDTRVRLFGVNFAFGANFPEAKDAPRIAKRLRRLGVNLVRLHHMDTQPDAQASTANSILTQGPYPTLNPVSTARLRTLLDALKAEGVYVDLNLHVGYTYRGGVDGVPAAAPSYSKPVHAIYPKMIELEQQYARAVIDALALHGDPVLALVEINNEDSLLYSWQANALDRNVTGVYLDEMNAQWSRFLRARYGSTEALRSAWGGGGPDGPQLLGASGWQLEIHSPSRATLRSGEEIEVTVQQGGDWVYAKQVGFSLAAGQPYLGEVEIRADLPSGESRNVFWDVKEDVSPWRGTASRSIAVTNQWTRYTLGFDASLSMNRVGRFALEVQSMAGTTVHIRNWSLKQVGRRGLAETESLEAGNVAPVFPTEPGTEARTNDFLLYLADADRQYLNHVAAAVRESAGPLVPITGTQVAFGGLMTFDSHDGMDFIDHHFYVDHYAFPHTSWDGYDWTIQDSSAAGANLTPLVTVAAGRQHGKPFTVSEFNQPWPNTHAAELDVEIAAFGSFQDWDGLMHFAYAHGRGWDDNAPNGFNLNGDWTKWVNVGQAAWLFRTFAVRPGVETVELPAPLDARLRATRERRNSGIASFFNAAVGFDANLTFVHPIAVSKDNPERPQAIALGHPVASYRSDTGELTFDPQRRLYRIDAPMAAGVVGFAGAAKATAGPLDVELTQGGSGFLTMLLTSLDGKEIGESSRMLLTAPGASLRTQPGSDPARPQQLVRYAGGNLWTLERDPAQPAKPSGNLNGGSRPTWMERIEACVTIRTSRPALTVYPLDGTGVRLAPIEVTRVEEGFGFRINADGAPFSPWFEIVE
jgi:hypothetical protein